MRGQLERQGKSPEHSSSLFLIPRKSSLSLTVRFVFVKKDLKQKFVGNFVNIYMLSPRKGKL